MRPVGGSRSGGYAQPMTNPGRRRAQGALDRGRRPGRVAVLASVALLQACEAAIDPAPAFAPRRGEIACNGAQGRVAADGARTFLWRPEALEQARTRVDAGDPRLLAARTALIAEADAALGRGPYTVTAKTSLPASGDRHDYYSLATYWWPDPAQRDGLPYVRRDGQRNPERLTARYDLTALEAMARDVTTLGLAYHATRERRYAIHAARLLRAWFVDPATRMNPHMTYAQAVPGRSEGRPVGIIDTRGFVTMIDAVGLLPPSGALSAADTAGLKAWFGEYVDWLTTSDMGDDERDARNNHSLYFDTQLMAFALFAGRVDAAEETARAFTRRIADQVGDDGALPREIERPGSFHYQVFATAALFDAAALAECVGVDLWRYQAGPRSIRAALDYIARHDGVAAAWPHPDETTPADRAKDMGQLATTLARAAAAYAEPAYADRALRHVPVAAAGPELLTDPLPFDGPVRAAAAPPASR